MISFPKTHILGVLNLTPDSFSDGGIYFSHVEQAITRAQQLIKDGADYIDIGGESSRPGAQYINAEEELKRVLPVVQALRREGTASLSIDTYKPEVAEACLMAGATMINDITGLASPEMRHVMAKYHASAVLMHMQGTPQTMQRTPSYQNVVEEIKAFFQERIMLAKKAGIENIILDPGIGFGKTLEHNLHILKHLDAFLDLGYPLLVGTSRKSFIGQVTNLPVDQRLEGTIASIVSARHAGATWVRVHDVLACRRALDITDAILHA